MELIDKAALPEHKFPEVQCNGFGDGPAYRQGWNDAIDAIVDNEDTVDAVPVRRGRWVMIEGELAFWDKCSECGKKILHRTPYYDFCPNCGANMRKDGEQHGQTE